MNSPRQTSQIKREILVRLIKAYLGDNFEEETRKIPYDMRPKGSDVPYRCCIFKERAIIRDRAIAGLGTSIEDTDDSVLLSDIAKKLKIEFNRKNTRLLFLPQLVRVVFHQEFSLQTYAKVVSQDLAKALVDSEQSLFMTENLTLIPKNVKIAECVLKFVHIKQSKESSFLVRMHVRLVQSLKAKTDMQNRF